MENSPLIVTVSRKVFIQNQPIQYSYQNHLELIIEAGGRPMILPATPSAESVLMKYAESMHGLFLTEGADIEPLLYNAPPGSVAFAGDTDPAVDFLEFALVRYALQNNIPVLGIGRGMHILNNICGGDLYVELGRERKQGENHYNLGGEDKRHKIRIEENTPLSHIMGIQEAEVLSGHHQGIRRIGRELKPMAHAEDGLIEAIYHPDRTFAMGLQFQLDKQQADYTEACLRLYGLFVQAAGENVE